MQTAEQVKQKLIELEENYKIRRNSLIEEYKKLSPIQVGDKVKVTHENGNVELGECVDVRMIVDVIVNKLKKDGTVSNNDRIYLWHKSKIEKL